MGVMNTRRRHAPRAGEEGVYTGPSQTQTQLVQQTESCPVSVPLSVIQPVDPGGMSGRDRTVEFQSVCNQLQGRQVRCFYTVIKII